MLALALLYYMLRGSPANEHVANNVKLMPAEEAKKSGIYILNYAVLKPH